MRTKTQRKGIAHGGVHRRVFAVLLVFCLMLSQLNFGLMVAYALNNDPLMFQVGANVTAELSGGVLTLTGTGETEDFQVETAPFLDCSAEIHELVIEDGITYIGAYLFYGLGKLSGRLTLPESIVGFGAHAFSGDSQETAPSFTVIENLFVSGEIVRQKQQAEEKPLDSGAQGSEIQTPNQEPVQPPEPPAPSEQPSGTQTPNEEEPPISDMTEPPQADKEESDIPVEGGQKQQPEEGDENLEQGNESIVEGEPDPDAAAAPDPSTSPDGDVTTASPLAMTSAYAAHITLFRGVELTDMAIPLAEAPLAGDVSDMTGDAAPSVGDSSDTAEEDSAPAEDPGGLTENTEGGDSSDNTSTVPDSDNQSGGSPDENGAGNAESTAPSDDTGTPDSPSSEGQENVIPGGSSETDGDPLGTDSVPVEDSGSLEDGSDNQYTVEWITEQEIAHPDTLFYPGQSGVVICSDENRTFLEAALAAGYRLADDMVTVILDDKLELELPLADGMVALPECPAEISSPYESGVFLTHVFSGWTQTPEDESAPVLTAGELLQAEGQERISLYSVWGSQENYELKIQVAIEGDMAVYTLLDSATDQALIAPDGYALMYQWQIAARGDGDSADWVDIDGANESVHSRALSPTDSGMQLRCAVTAVQLLRTMVNGASPVLYSQPVNALAEISTVYVDQSHGDNNNNGTKESPVKTLDAAAAKLKTSAEGGTVETNLIVIIGEYIRSEEEQKLFQTRPVPVTITGEEGAVLMGAKEAVTGNDYPLYLYEALCLSSIKVERLNHIYGNGHNITIGDNVNNEGNAFYLYGSGQNSLTDATKVGALTVKSGSTVRIVGYVRSNPTVDCKNLKSNITVEGSANVSMVVAGSASGEIKNANVNINIKGGTVGTLIGGNQGFSNLASPFSGTTSINITGGKVQNLYGAGSGRNLSIPTYLGELNINVSGGSVTNLYGGGSAAYVISNQSTTTKVNITVSNGQVGNLFAAGRGWDPAGSLGTNGSSATDTFAGGAVPGDFGSLTGMAEITVSGGTVGNIYASGEGYKLDSRTQSNAYLDGEADIRVTGGIVTGSIYGGGKGIDASGYEDCARVTTDSQVRVEVAGGTVQGNIYGGGQIARVDGVTSVTLTNGIMQSNVYGGGDQGKVKGSATVNINGGTVNGSVYGGSLGTPGSVLVLGGSTVNMTGGWVRGNLYGGSEFSDDGAALAENAAVPDLIFVNLTGGMVSGNVFGGGYRGTVHGSTHLHIGAGAMGACAYYSGHPDETPFLTLSTISVGGSVYAGGDFGGDGADYNAITVEGTSHVYIDGTGYDTTGGSGTGMSVSGGVFGSGASCDAGKTRLVTLKNYGQVVKDDNGTVTGATRTLAAIQRADRVLLLNSHVRLTGQSDAANANQTALYTLNRIGNHGVVDDLGALGNGLVLQGGSTVVLESAGLELAGFRSLDSSGQEVTMHTIQTSPNTLLLNTGTLLRLSYTDKNNGEVYGPVEGYAYLLAAASAEGYAYARISPDEAPSGTGQDGGFAGQDGQVISYTNVVDASPPYRYWKVHGAGEANVTRQTVLTAQTLTEDQAGYGSDGYSVAKGVIELPPADKGSVYTIQNITLHGSGVLKLAEAVKNGQGADAGWALSGANINVDTEKATITGSPLNTFGLFMKIGSGFEGGAGTPGKVISSQSITSGVNSIIGTQTTGNVSGDNVVPQIEFYLTYDNNGITASQDLGTVQIIFERTVNGNKQETTTVDIQILTKTTSLSSLEVDLYATQTGSYTGRLYIPAGNSRSLSLSGVLASENAELVEGVDILSGQKFAVSIQAVRNQGWLSSGLMDSPYDLGGFKAGTAVQLGSTDSRYEAPVEFVLTNAPGFTPKETDIVTLTLTDASVEDAVKVTLRIHWEESVVSAISVGAGRKYNGLQHENDLTISQNSAMTSVFVLSESLNVDALWLELWDQNDKAVALPAETGLTLLNGTNFYSYQATGTETEVKVELTGFTSMGGDAKLTGMISGQVIVILDFGSSDTPLPVGEYSLRLRNSGTADTIGAGFILINTGATASISGGEGLSKGTHMFTLTITQGSDTRFSTGAAVVLCPEAGESFPEGTVFTLGGKSYYPSGGKVYIPFNDAESQQILMDTTNSTGLSAGEHTLYAQIFPTGANAGNTKALSAAASYTVQPNPSYGLSVSLKNNESRIVSPGSTLTFTADYSVENSSLPCQILVSVQRKSGISYVDSQPWSTSGNDSLGSGSGRQSISVTAPTGLEPGTYRLYFHLGDQSAPYNLIVSN